MKICPTCKESKPLSEFGSNKRRDDGLCVYCKPCYREYMLHYKRKRLKDPEYRAAYNAAVLASATRRFKDPEQRAIKNANNRACKRRLVADDAVRIALNARKRAWITEKFKDPAFLARHRAAYRSAHKRLRQATPPWANKDKIFDIYFEAAQLRQAGQDVHVDHVIPLRGKTVSGLHVETNLRIIPAIDNLQKLNKFLEELIYVVTGS